MSHKHPATRGANQVPPHVGVRCVHFVDDDNLARQPEMAEGDVARLERAEQDLVDGADDKVGGLPLRRPLQPRRHGGLLRALGPTVRFLTVVNASRIALCRKSPK